ncbi:hypothetical protein PTKIN_Ptkin13bG0146500 [Pterospermum kingtungense]
MISSVDVYHVVAATPIVCSHDFGLHIREMVEDVYTRAMCKHKQAMHGDASTSSSLLAQIIFLQSVISYNLLLLLFELHAIKVTKRPLEKHRSVYGIKACGIRMATVKHHLFIQQWN